MATHHTPDGVRLELRLSAGRCEIETAETAETVVEAEPMNGSAASREAAAALVENLSERRAAGPTLVVAMPKLRRLMSGLNNAQVLVRIRAPARRRPRRRHGVGRCRRPRTARRGRRAHRLRRRVDRGGGAGHRGEDRERRRRRAVSLRGARQRQHDVRRRDHWRVGAALSVNTMSGDVSDRAGRVRNDPGAQHVGRRQRPGSPVAPRLFVDANSASGDVRSELPVTGSAPDGGEADVELRATSMSGDIVVVRAPESVSAHA